MSKITIIPSGTKVMLDGVQSSVTTNKDISLNSLISTVEDLYTNISVTGYYAFDKEKKRIRFKTMDRQDFKPNPSVFLEGTLISFIADGGIKEFPLQRDTTLETIDKAIKERYGTYREESLFIGGKSHMFPHLKNAYLSIEGRIASHFDKTIFPISKANNILKFGLRKGDILHIKGLTSFKVVEAEYSKTNVVVYVK